MTGLRTAAAAILIACSVAACGPGSTTVTANDSSSASPLPAAPAPPGTKLVGADGIAIAVPDDWAQVTQPSCAAPEHDSYYLTEHVAQDFSCPMEPAVPAAQGSTLAIETPPVPGGAPSPAGADCGTRSCHEVWRQGEVTFDATIVAAPADARQTLARLGASIEPIPDGYTAVPLWPVARSSEQAVEPGDSICAPVTPAAYADLVTQAGLDPMAGDEATCPDRTTDPAQGTVVGAGTPVTLGGPVADPTPVAHDPVAPDGMRLVGARGVAIAVPAAWRETEQPLCGNASEGSYYFTQATDYAPPCAPPVRPSRPADHLVITDAGTQPQDDGAPTPQDGQVVCDGETCVGEWTETGTRFVVTVSGDAAHDLLDRIASTVQPLPPGWTTVPLWPSEVGPTGAYGPEPESRYVEMLGTAGFVVARASDGTPPVGSRVQPVQGAVVRSGAAVDIDDDPAAPTG